MSNNIEALKIQLDNDYEGSIFDEPPSKKERQESRRSFLDGLQKAVENGGEVIVEKANNINLFYFKETGGNMSWSISREDAINHCGYTEIEN